MFQDRCKKVVGLYNHILSEKIVNRKIEGSQTLLQNIRDKTDINSYRPLILLVHVYKIQFTHLVGR